jgi:hypothetical protein
MHRVERGCRLQAGPSFTSMSFAPDIIANQPIVIDNGSGVLKAGFAGMRIAPTALSYRWL